MVGIYWNTSFLLGWPIFRGELLVSGRVTPKKWSDGPVFLTWLRGPPYRAWVHREKSFWKFMASIWGKTDVEKSHLWQGQIGTTNINSENHRWYLCIYGISITCHVCIYILSFFMIIHIYIFMI